MTSRIINHHGNVEDVSGPAFTPGPWRLDRTNDERMVLSSVTTTDEMGDTYPVPVADLHRGGYDYGDLGYSLEANACLITAAPELYEALHQILLRFGRDIKAYDGDQYHAAYDALAKARGEHD